jgi:hypothetical protein
VPRPCSDRVEDQWLCHPRLGRNFIFGCHHTPIQLPTSFKNPFAIVFARLCIRLIFVVKVQSAICPLRFHFINSKVEVPIMANRMSSKTRLTSQFICVITTLSAILSSWKTISQIIRLFFTLSKIFKSWRTVLSATNSASAKSPSPRLVVFSESMKSHFQRGDCLLLQRRVKVIEIEEAIACRLENSSLPDRTIHRAVRQK